MLPQGKDTSVIPEHDAEKAVNVRVSSDKASSPPPAIAIDNEQPTSTLKRWNQRIENLAGLEARGLERVPDEERLAPSNANFLQMFLLWLSSNMTIICTAAAVTGPTVFELGFTDSCWLAVFGTLLGACTTAYMSTWGAVSGNRMMVCARFVMGYYPAKLCAFLNIILMVGYCTLDNIVGGQVLAAVGNITILAGVVIVAVIMCVLAVFGLKIFHHYQRFAWLPQLVALMVLIGSAGNKFDHSLQPTATGRTLAAYRLSFFSLMFYLPNSWVASAADYYVYYPANTPKWKIFTVTVVGLFFAIVTVDLIGVAIASGIVSTPAWNDAFGVSSGALIVEALSPIGGFGKFCAVVLALGVISNAVMGTYSASIDAQIMGRWGQMVPRYVWVVILSAIQLACGLAGRNQLYIIFTNFLALMAYWLTPMMCIFLEEQFLFQPKLVIDWDAWADPKRMPVGIAALSAFLLGWLGAVLGMSQIYFVGPLARLGGYADVGMWVGAGFALVSYAPLRHFELKKFGR